MYFGRVMLSQLLLPDKPAMIYLCLPATIFWVIVSIGAYEELIEKEAQWRYYFLAFAFPLLTTYIPEAAIASSDLYAPYFPGWLVPALLLCGLISTVLPLSIAAIRQRRKSSAANRKD